MTAVCEWAVQNKVLAASCICAADSKGPLCSKGSVCFRPATGSTVYTCASESVTGRKETVTLDSGKFCTDGKPNNATVTLITGAGYCYENGVFKPNCSRIDLVLGAEDGCTCGAGVYCEPGNVCFKTGSAGGALECYSQVDESGIAGPQAYALVGSEAMPVMMRPGEYYDAKAKKIISTCLSEGTPLSTECNCVDQSGSTVLTGKKCAAGEFCYMLGGISCVPVADMSKKLQSRAMCGTQLCVAGEYCLNLDAEKKALDSGSFCASEIAVGASAEGDYGYCAAAGKQGLCLGTDTKCTAALGCECAVTTDQVQSFGTCAAGEGKTCTLGQLWDGKDCFDPEPPTTEEIVNKLVITEGPIKCGATTTISKLGVQYCYDEKIYPQCSLAGKTVEKCICVVDSTGETENFFSLVGENAICIPDVGIFCPPGYEYTDETRSNCKVAGPVEPLALCANNAANCTRVGTGLCKATEFGCLCNGSAINYKYCSITATAEAVLEDCAAQGGLSSASLALKPCVCDTRDFKIAEVGDKCAGSVLTRKCSGANKNLGNNNIVTEACQCGSNSALASVGQQCENGVIYNKCTVAEAGFALQNPGPKQCVCNQDIVPKNDYCYSAGEGNTKKVDFCKNAGVVVAGDECICTSTSQVAIEGQQCKNKTIYKACEVAEAGFVVQHLDSEDCACNNDIVTFEEYCYSSDGKANTKRVAPCEETDIITSGGECICTQAGQVATVGQQCIIGSSDGQIKSFCLEDQSTCTKVATEGASLCRRVSDTLDCACVGEQFLGDTKYCYKPAGGANEVLSDCRASPLDNAFFENPVAKKCVCHTDVISHGEYCYSQTAGQNLKEIHACAGVAGAELPIAQGGECVCNGGLALPGDVCAVGSGVITKCVAGANCTGTAALCAAETLCACGGQRIEKTALLTEYCGLGQNAIKSCVGQLNSDKTAKADCACGTAGVARAGDICDGAVTEVCKANNSEAITAGGLVIYRASRKCQCGAAAVEAGGYCQAKAGTLAPLGRCAPGPVGASSNCYCGEQLSSASFLKAGFCTAQGLFLPCDQPRMETTAGACKCIPNATFISDGCVCSAGFGGENCVQCTGNTVSANAEACWACPNGAVPNAAHTRCAQCPSDQIAGQNGQACEPCDPNHVPSPDQTVCVKCVAGYANTGDIVCSVCNPGLAPGDIGSGKLACQKCPDNKYSPDGQECKDAAGFASSDRTQNVESCGVIGELKSAATGQAKQCVKQCDTTQAVSLDGFSCAAVLTDAQMKEQNCVLLEGKYFCAAGYAYDAKEAKCVQITCVKDCQLCQDSSICLQCRNKYKLVGSNCKKEGLSGGGIAGIVIAVLIFVVLACVVVYLCMKILGGKRGKQGSGNGNRDNAVAFAQD